MPIDEARKKFVILMGNVYKRNGIEYLKPEWAQIENEYEACLKRNIKFGKNKAIYEK